MTTKEKIEQEALNLFCVKGYSGTSIREIAKAVGIKDSSIYKHYSSKEEIFNQILEHFYELSESIFSKVVVSESFLEEVKDISILTDMVKATFETFVGKEYISKCRRLMMISAPGETKFARLYAQYFVEAPLLCNQEMMKLLMVKGYFRQGDAISMAYQFYSPIMNMIIESDGGFLSMEEARDRIDKHVKQFTEVYSI